MFAASLSFIDQFISEFSLGLESISPQRGFLTKKQIEFIAFALKAILVTNTVCWKVWEKMSCQKVTDSGLNWMFYKSTIPWLFLLQAAVKVLLKKNRIKKGILVIDDSDRSRSKKTTHIGKTHKIKDKKTNGYVNGQNLVFVLLVSDTISIPVGFYFYKPDPAYTLWKQQDEKLKKERIPKKERPEKPSKSEEYPTKIELASKLVSSFFENFPEVNITSIVADALYGSSSFFKDLLKMKKGIQIISQLRYNQNIIDPSNGKELSVSAFFLHKRAKKHKLIIRGQDKKVIHYCAQNLFIPSHGCKRTVIAIKYDEEETYRYIVASNTGWCPLDILQTYTIRWLIEVFFQDWKSYEGWNNLAKQQGDEGSSRGVILSLLLDLSFFYHPDQQNCIKNKLPLFTIGSLIENEKKEVLLNQIWFVIQSENPLKTFKDFESAFMQTSFKRTSKKHLAGIGFKNILPYFA